jgi:hypothetical protein
MQFSNVSRIHFTGSGLGPRSRFLVEHDFTYDKTHDASV